MTVQLTAPVEGKNVGDDYTGANEAYHLASGNASQAGYVGPGVPNTGDADTSIANNREFDTTRAERVEPDPTKPLASTPAEATNDDVVVKPTFTDVIANAPAEWPTSVSKLYAIVNGKIAAASGPAAGGTVVHVRGFGLTDVTGVNFDGVAGTAFTVVSDREITVTTPAGAAGPADVVLVDPDGNETVVGGFTYTA